MVVCLSYYFVEYFQFWWKAGSRLPNDNGPCGCHATATSVATIGPSHPTDLCNQRSENWVGPIFFSHPPVSAFVCLVHGRRNTCSYCCMFCERKNTCVAKTGLWSARCSSMRVPIKQIDNAVKRYKIHRIKCVKSYFTSNYTADSLGGQRSGQTGTTFLAT